MIADAATERGLDFSAELITSVSRCDVARGIPRYGITPRASGNTIIYRLYGEGRFPLPALQGHSPKHRRTETFDAR
jgi:hypothetical protein